MKIAVSGKGGSGKTTIAGLLARHFAHEGRPVLAIDGDSNPNLGLALGLEPEAVGAMPVLPRDVVGQVNGDDGTPQEGLLVPLEELMGRYGTPAPEGIRMLSMARIDHAGKG